jgi:hypothetical protein
MPPGEDGMGEREREREREREKERKGAAEDQMAAYGTQSDRPL